MAEEATSEDADAEDSPTDESGNGQEDWKVPLASTKEHLFNFFTREDSISIDLSDVQRPITRDEQVEIIKDVMRVPLNKIIDVSLNMIRRTLLIKFADEETQLLVQEKLDDSSYFWPKMKLRLSGWMCHERTVAVHIYGVSPEVPDEEVVAVMRRYGNVRHLKHGKIPELGPNVTDGSIRLRMVLEGLDREVLSLPAYLMNEKKGEIWQIDRQDFRRKVCWRCQQEGHIGRFCTNNEDVKKKATYAKKARGARRRRGGKSGQAGQQPGLSKQPASETAKESVKNDENESQSDSDDEEGDGGAVFEIKDDLNPKDPRLAEKFEQRRQVLEKVTQLRSLQIEQNWAPSCSELKEVVVALALAAPGLWPESCIDGPLESYHVRFNFVAAENTIKLDAFKNASADSSKHAAALKIAGSSRKRELSPSGSDAEQGKHKMPQVVSVPPRKS